MAADLTSGPFEVLASPQAMARFAFSSAGTIATLLCLPDGFGIASDVPNALVWSVRVIGLWLSAFILWGFGFLGLLYAVRLLSGGVQLHEGGIKLWRFGKLLPWGAIKALSCEPQPLFSKAFLLRPQAYRLTLYTDKHPLHIPSFQFDGDDFTSLVAYTSRRVFGFMPNDQHVLLADVEQRQSLKREYERGRVFRVVISLIIFLSLVSFLGRKSWLYYSFNRANREFRAERYAEAEGYYRTATAVDRTFAPAWDRLARAEWRQGKAEQAESDWRQALVMKPDFVEAKLGLAGAQVRKGNLVEARRLLESACRLAPTNLATYISLADLYGRLGNVQSGIDTVGKVLQVQPTNLRARALEARLLYLAGRQMDAQVALRQCDPSAPGTAASDIAFWQSVKAELEKHGVKP